MCLCIGTLCVSLYRKAHSAARLNKACNTQLHRHLTHVDVLFHLSTQYPISPVFHTLHSENALPFIILRQYRFSIHRKFPRAGTICRLVRGAFEIEKPREKETKKRRIEKRNKIKIHKQFSNQNEQTEKNQTMESKLFRWFY